MGTAHYELRTTRVPLSGAISRLEVFVSRMERRYECKSETMDADVKAGRARATQEVAKWLGEYHTLTRLRAAGNETGSITTPTS